MRINCFSAVVKDKRVMSPINVKEILVDCPNHEMFEADQSSRLNMPSRPLSSTTPFRPSRLYFLTPLPTQLQSKPSSTSSPAFRPQLYSKSVCDKDVTADDVMSRLISSTTHGSTVRLKIRLSKEEAISLLSADGNKAIGDLLSPFIEHAINEEKQNSWDSIPPQWKPSLETIFEEPSPCLGQ